jgi:hypothetical protein
MISLGADDGHSAKSSLGLKKALLQLVPWRMPSDKVSGPS